MEAWVEENLDTLPTIEGELFVSILYGIWISRNKLCFENRKTPPEVVITNAISAFKSFSELRRSHGGHRPGTQNRQLMECPVWKPPARGNFKLNADAAEMESYEWGLGAVIRDKEGRVLLMASERISLVGDARLAEAVAMRWGLSLALENSFCKMEVESDCLELVDVINGKKEDVSYFVDLAQDYGQFGLLLGVVSFTHVKRGCNRVAHHLAKNSYVFGTSVWLEHGPVEALNLASLDVISCYNQ